MNEDFIKEVAQSIRFRQPELVEKDLIIHIFLSRFAADPFFQEPPPQNGRKSC